MVAVREQTVEPAYSEKVIHKKENIPTFTLQQKQIFR